MFFAGFDLLFSILFPILFLVVLGMILYAIIGNIRTWNKNNHSPRLTVPATVVAKRTVDGSEYGMLVESDIGKLSFQGTRYLGFQRN